MTRGLALICHKLYWNYPSRITVTSFTLANSGYKAPLNSWKHHFIIYFAACYLWWHLNEWGSVKRVGSFMRTPKPLQRVEHVNGEREWTACKRVIGKQASLCYIILHHVYNSPLNQPSILPNYVNHHDWTAHTRLLRKHVSSWQTTFCSMYLWLVIILMR